MNIWQFQSHLTRRLLNWSFLSLAIGIFLQIHGSRFVRGLGQQFAAWGLIDALIAIFGKRSAQKRQANLMDPLASEITSQESRKLRMILWINAGLDIGYMAGGIGLALTKGNENTGWRGHGIGIIIQGGFLMIFDLIHALKIPTLEGNKKRGQRT
jgi:hypothetical protein